MSESNKTSSLPIPPATVPPPVAPPVVSIKTSGPHSLGPPTVPPLARQFATPPPVLTLVESPSLLSNAPPRAIVTSAWSRWFGTSVQSTEAGTAGERRAQLAEQRQRLPAWMVSFVAHLVFILILAMTPFARLAQGPLTFMFGFSDAAGLAPFELSEIDSDVDDQPQESELDSFDTIDAGQLLKIDLPQLVTLNASETLGSNPQLASLDIPFGIINGLKGRSGVLKEALLSRFGGTQATEDAVELGLAWLAKQQKSNGSWSLVGPYGQGGANENATAATALALNAFLGAGSTHIQGQYQANVKLGLAYLVRQQNEDGYFPNSREPSRQQMYAQAIATIAIAEAYGMSGDSELKTAAQRAMKFAAWSQSKRYGWRYEPREDADLSVTGWFVMAMETGKMAGLQVDEAKLQKVTDFLDTVSYEEKSRYGYDGFEPASLSMTAEGLLCRIYLGWPSTHPALLQAIRDDLLPNTPSTDDTSYSVYYWYYATQVLHHVGGTAWEAWNRDMRRVIPSLQEKSGPEAGSWSPNNDAFGAAGGRLYTTCLNR